MAPGGPAAPAKPAADAAPKPEDAAPKPGAGADAGDEGDDGDADLPPDDGDASHITVTSRTGKDGGKPKVTHVGPARPSEKAGAPAAAKPDEKPAGGDAGAPAE